MANTVERVYSRVLADHLAKLRQMAFVTGPRQVGKTTVCRGLAEHYLDWDDPDARRLILKGPRSVAGELELDRARERPPVVVFDELHKHRRWRAFLKGLFDLYADQARFVVTGSARLDIYRRGGESLMGRYFHYRMHPLSAGELLRPRVEEGIAPSARLPLAEQTALLEHGGFPEPLLHRDPRFTRRWLRLRREQLVRGDIRDLTAVQELDQLEVMVALLAERSAAQLSYSNLARDLSVSVDTARRWVALLCSVYHGFLLRPWFSNVKKSLRKEPRWFAVDWAAVPDSRARLETLVAGHLRKAVELWTDLGIGEYSLHYLRDKAQREVDFLVTRDRQPWLLLEVKTSDARLSPHLEHFQAQLSAPHVLQAVLELPYENVDCFALRRPAVVPLWTLLSQLP